MMHKRSIVLAVLASFFVGGTVMAVTQRDITARLGGKAGQVFKLVGTLVVKTLQVDTNLRVDGGIYRGTKAGAGDKKPVVINDDFLVRGDITGKKLTINSLSVSGTKRYSGTFDTSATGDFVSTMSYSTVDCTNPSYATSIQTSATHYKAITIPEVTLAALPDIRVFYRTQTSTNFNPASLVYTPSMYPNGNDNWLPLTTYLNEGKAYFSYKTVTTQCNGTVTNTISTTGEYQVVIH